MHPNTRGLAFLLSIGTLPIACAKEKQESETDTDSTGLGMTTGTQGQGQSTTDTPTTGTSEPTGGSEGATGTTSGTTSGTSTGDDTEPSVTTFLTTNSTGTSGETETEGLPPVTDPQCLAYGAKFAECLPRYASYRQYLAYYCQSYKNMGMALDGPACVEALEAQYVCMIEAPCADYQGDQFPCPEEQALAITACPKTFEPGMTSETSETETDSGGTSSTG